MFIGLEREEEREREKEKESLMWERNVHWLPPVCVLTEDSTHNLLVYQTLQPTTRLGPGQHLKGSSERLGQRTIDWARPWRVLKASLSISWLTKPKVIGRGSRDQIWVLEIQICQNCTEWNASDYKLKALWWCTKYWMFLRYRVFTNMVYHWTTFLHAYWGWQKRKRWCRSPSQSSQI